MRVLFIKTAHSQDLSLHVLIRECSFPSVWNCSTLSCHILYSPNNKSYMWQIKLKKRHPRNRNPDCRHDTQWLSFVIWEHFENHWKSIQSLFAWSPLTDNKNKSVLMSRGVSRMYRGQGLIPRVVCKPNPILFSTLASSFFAASLRRERRSCISQIWNISTGVHP